MKKLIILFILFILAAAPIVLADSSITVETTINENVYVTLNLANIESQTYDEIKAQGFNISTVPNAIEEKLKQQNLTDASVIYDFNQEIFNDNTLSISLKLLLTGPDIISYTLNKTDMTRTFQVRTDWRKIEISFAQNFSLNLEEHFGVPLVDWQQVNHTMANGKIYPAFERNVEDPFEISFRFILPEKAFDIQTEEDTVIFKVPTAFEDRLLNSPFLILGAIIIANIIFVAYRKVRK